MNERDFLESMDLELNRPEVTPFKLKSRFNPPATHDSIDTFHEVVVRELFEVWRSSKKGDYESNPDQAQKLALKSLIDDRNIEIKPSDKGGNVVLWDVNKYCKEAERQL
ncbi:hypothetical protein NDU88_011869, partial [Pleurodeles waltl]